MKNAKRLFFGVLSSLLFVVGLVRAAERLDPINGDLRVNHGAVQIGTPDCSSPCDVYDTNS